MTKGSMFIARATPFLSFQMALLLMLLALVALPLADAQLCARIMSNGGMFACNG